MACDLELWAEAFRSVEDIQALISLSKKQPKQQMMATYYAKLTQIFAMSGHHMYHAYAWLKLFSFSKSYNKNLTHAGEAREAAAEAAEAVQQYMEQQRGRCCCSCTGSSGSGYCPGQ